MNAIVAFLAPFVLASTLFIPLELSVAQYLLLLDAVILLLLLSYGRRENFAFFRKVLITAMGCSAAFALSKVMDGYRLCKPTALETVLLVVVVGEAIAVACLLRGEKAIQTEKQPIHAERQYDLERIRAYIRDFEVVGVNAEWGAGKSFVVEQLKDDETIRNEYDIIQIDLLTCNLDSVELVVVEELEKLFQKHRLHPGCARRLKRLLGKNEWADFLRGLLEEDSEGLSSAFENFRQGLGMIKKKVLLIFEDVDRIPSEDTMRKIFAISEKLAGERLRVIFQYDVRELEGKGLDWRYMEKYIPYTVNLTSIQYPRLVEYLWDELQMDSCPIEIDEVRRVTTNLPGVFEAESALGVKMNIGVDLVGLATTRKVRIFLLELKHILAENEELRTGENAEITMRVLFVKHFFNHIYKNFLIGTSPLDSLVFIDGGKELTLPALLEKYKKPQMEAQDQWKERTTKAFNIINEERNRYHWFVLLLLGYNVEPKKEMANIDEVAAESVVDLKMQEKNRKIDRLVWNVIANGTSELTDMENALRKLREEVLPFEGEEREKAWVRYGNDMYHGRLRKDNITVFKMLWDPFLSLFRAMAVLGADEEVWSRFLGLYFSQFQKTSKTKVISSPFIDNCNYAPMGQKRTFFCIIRFFNELTVVGNFNGDESYCTFLRTYMGNIARLGYVRYMEPSMFEFSDKKERFRECAEAVLGELKKELKERWANQSLSYVQKEYDELIEFVEKNLEVIKSPKHLERGPTVKADTHAEYVHQKEINRLKKLREDRPEEYEVALEESYLAGKLYLRELEVLQGD